MTILRTQLRGVGRRPAKLLLTGLGIVVAAFFAHATVLAQQVTERAVGDGLSETPAAASVVLKAGDDLLPPATLAAVRDTAGVVEVAGRVQGGLQYGDEKSSTYFGVSTDPGSGPLSRVQVVSGSYPDAAGEVAITEKTADRDGLRAGQRITLSTQGDLDANGDPRPGRPVTLLVTGVVKAPGDYGQQLYAQDQAGAALLASGYSRIDVRAGPGTSAAELTNTLAARIGQAEVLDGATARQREIDEKVDEIEPIFALLAMFVVIAVIAAALVVTSTFRIMFAQRMSQLALLRAVGAARGRIAGALVVEGAVTGAVAGTTGVLVALAAGFAVPAVTGGFGRSLPAPGPQLGWAVAIIAGSVLVTLVAVLAPAFSAARVSPLQALRTSATTTARGGIGVFRALIGVVLALAALGSAGLALAGVSDGDTMLGLAVIVFSGTAAFGALLALGPVILRPVLKVVGWPFTRFGPVGRLAVGGVGGAPRRAAAVSAVVALGVTLVAGVLVGSATLRNLADAELAMEYPADIEARATDGVLPDGLASRLARRDEFAEVLPYRRVTASTGRYEEFRVADLDIRKLPLATKFRVVDGSLDDLGPGAVALPEMYDELGRAGDDVVLKLGNRTVTVRVGAVLSGSGPLTGTAIVDPGELARLDPTAKPVGVFLNAAGDGEEGVTKARSAVLDEAGNAPGLAVDTLADGRAEAIGWINATTAIALALLGLTVLIAVVGVGTTTALSVVERTRESGMLRAVGLSTGGLRTSLTAEAGLYGAIGSVLGLALGVPYAALMLSSLDIGAPLVIPAGQLAIVFALLAALTAVAGLLPANRAAKVSPVAALAHE